MGLVRKTIYLLDTGMFQHFGELSDLLAGQAHVILTRPPAISVIVGEPKEQSFVMLVNEGEVVSRAVWLRVVPPIILEIMESHYATRGECPTLVVAHPSLVNT